VAVEWPDGRSRMDVFFWLLAAVILYFLFIRQSG
jgi:hypothetical protein